MLKTELDAMTKTLAATAYHNRFDLLNLSDITSNLIKTTAKYCDCFASDILIEIDSLRGALREAEPSQHSVRYLGYRDWGVDHTAFILQRRRSDYLHLQMIEFSVNHVRDISIALYDLSDAEEEG